ncbi:hypothetical protein CANCADRAFT_18799, partial [Tortispora caseinolytica NRRL Y-17796]
MWSPDDQLSQSAQQKAPIGFFHILENLKTTKRTGWVQFGVPNPESISDHMYRMGIISFLAPKDLDRDRCIKMSIVHDMAESLVGDFTPRDDISSEEKHRRESETMDLLTKLAGTGDLQMRELWHEYEQGTTPEALFVKSVDKFELLLQMVEYERRSNGSLDLSDFLSVLPAITHPKVKEWADLVIKERN